MACGLWYTEESDYVACRALRSQTMWQVGHCGVRLCGKWDTVESDYVASWTLWSQTLWHGDTSWSGRSLFSTLRPFSPWPPFSLEAVPSLLMAWEPLICLNQAAPGLACHLCHPTSSLLVSLVSMMTMCPRTTGTKVSSNLGSLEVLIMSDLSFSSSRAEKIACCMDFFTFHIWIS